MKKKLIIKVFGFKTALGKISDKNIEFRTTCIVVNYSADVAITRQE
jgi:hypothetical protein